MWSSVVEAIDDSAGAQRRPLLYSCTGMVRLLCSLSYVLDKARRVCENQWWSAGSCRVLIYRSSWSEGGLQRTICLALVGRHTDYIRTRISLRASTLKIYSRPMTTRRARTAYDDRRCSRGSRKPRHHHACSLCMAADWPACLLGQPLTQAESSKEDLMLRT